ncbi:MAG TPA: cytochrome c-type biogenesis protein CcmH [Solirubrobacteraceae bacterium]|jgi:cytochrome c-type biogenesis protein CcmH/NrfF
MRAQLAAAVLAVALLLGASTAAATTTMAPVKPRTSLPQIEPQVMCVTCKIPLNVAESKQADDERAFIQELIDKGEGEAEIKQALVGQYGPSVLGLPKASGFNLAVYLVPVAVVLALIATIALLLPRWRRQGRAARAAAAGASLPSLSPSDAARLDSDLARFDR